LFVLVVGGFLCFGVGGFDNRKTVGWTGEIVNNGAKMIKSKSTGLDMDRDLNGPWYFA